jgi:hypothetical protein
VPRIVRERAAVKKWPVVTASRIAVAILATTMRTRSALIRRQA